MKIRLVYMKECNGLITPVFTGTSEYYIIYCIHLLLGLLSR